MRWGWWSLGLAIAVAGCAGSERAEPVPEGKPEGVVREEVTPEVARPRRARIDDIAVEVRGPSPIARLVGADAADYPLRVDIVNRAGESVWLEDPALVVTVVRGGPRARICRPSTPASVGPRGLARGGRASVKLGLPCALGPGRHRVLATLYLGSEGTAPARSSELDLEVTP